MLWPFASGKTFQFSEADLVRAWLIRDLKVDFGVNDEGIAIVLHLLDQLHGLCYLVRDSRDGSVQSGQRWRLIGPLQRSHRTIQCEQDALRDSLRRGGQPASLVRNGAGGHRCCRIAPTVSDECKDRGDLRVIDTPGKRGHGGRCRHALRRRRTRPL